MVEPPNILADVLRRYLSMPGIQMPRGGTAAMKSGLARSHGEKHRLKGFTRCDFLVNFSTAKELDYLKVWSIYHKIPTEICEIKLYSDHIIYITKCCQQKYVFVENVLFFVFQC